MMNPRKKNNELKSKTDLIESVINQNLDNSPRIIKKIARQMQLFTKDNINNFREILSKNLKVNSRLIETN